MKQEHEQVRRAVRRAFLESDVVGLGTGGDWFPEDEYDAEADRAMSLLVRGLSLEEVVAWTVGAIARDWGVDIGPGKKQMLAAALAGAVGEHRGWA
ncbi:hypothetical protein [Arthrobacter celericrescens]|uniref:hypothetical protein n=1 Tax=Arthrobacter celericrescens TaxID=2320851 RepID=UPI000EA30683|nr:hypothetical protein [Arthrobacter celericrescens]